MSVSMTPSIAYGCINLLSIVVQQELSSQQLMLLKFGPVSSVEVIDHAASLKWISMGPGGIVTISERGKQCLNLPHVESQLRFLLREYFLCRRDPWLQLASRGRSHVLLQSPPEIQQLFHEAGLAGGVDLETIDFWDELAALLRGEKDKRHAEIGRLGENLTMLFEKNRTGLNARWMALESNHYGYDVLSHVSNGDQNPLKIEVKCSMASISTAKFHLTRFEWQTAVHSNSYKFHIWATSKHSIRLAALTVAEVAAHIPIDQNGGSWETVEVPYDLFEFQDIPVELALGLTSPIP